MLLPYMIKDTIECGCDEAGRGCLAGPVVAAAVILPPDFRNDLLNDSKQLTDHQRRLLRPIIQQQAICWAVAQCSNHEIDQHNILQCSIMAMHRAIDQLDPQPQHIIVDGNRFTPLRFIPYQTVVKGDGKYMSIAAASILAKTYRDDLMISLHEQYPQYGWNRNMGYPTKQHRKAVMQYGHTPLHRTTFNFRTDDITND